MNQHPYLRAYMAGIVAPTIFLLVAATAFTIARYVYNFPVPVERVIVFPMAVVPNIWGLWNVLYVAWRPRLQIPTRPPRRPVAFSARAARLCFSESLEFFNSRLCHPRLPDRRAAQR